jgi:hypothetical protein
MDVTSIASLKLQAMSLDGARAALEQAQAAPAGTPPADVILELSSAAQQLLGAS